MALLDLQKNISEAMNNNMFSIGVFFDISKAFDTVNHDILLFYFYILFRSNRKPVPEETCKLVIDNTEIPQVNSVKFLGVYVDQHLPWKIHLENVASKISKNIGI